MDIDTLIAAVQRGMEQLDGQDIELTPDDIRRLKAIADAFDDAVQQRVTPFQERIIKTLAVLSPRPESPPVSTTRLVASIGGLEGRWQAWYHLNALEGKGLVHRPRGPKSGWKVCLVA